MSLQLYDLAGDDERVRFSPYCWRIRMSLMHKGLEHETVPVRFGEKDKIAFSDQKLVPVLRDGETIVSDSWTIAEYLDRAFPDRPLLIQGEQGLALTRFFRHWAQGRIGPAILRNVLMDVFAAIAERDREYFRSSREQRFGMKLEEFQLPKEEGTRLLQGELAPVRETLADQPFMSGEAPAYADYILFGAFMWAHCVSARQLLEQDDPVYAWRERMFDLFDGFARKAPCFRKAA